VDIRVHEHGRHVVVLTVDNQPRLNAMSRQMMADLARLWDELDRGSCAVSSSPAPAPAPSARAPT
jgi:enoyl-CoA hydratase/carnithine racemase